ncbi:beta-hexosaminidase [Mycena rosella]|uniref:Beta-hexosaminidase n=1 Tax=Mycena rosella TaxID=1033263 RepID=A0AAD7D711_MYCRO|nr:beta-hexosaminidase [Mycena rosella]
MLYTKYAVFLAAIPRVLALWPIPRTLTTGTDFLRLSPTFTITVNVHDPPQDLLSAVSQTKTWAWFSDAGALKTAPVLPSLTLTLQNTLPVLSISAESVKDVLNRSEGYTLSIPSDGKPAVLSANSTLGLFRGLTTFSQFWYDLNGVTYTNVGPVSIVKDVPAYPYRGFMLDTARNFFPVSDIKRTLDAMSWVKINTFHWHIVDSQSFPLVLPDFPELAQKGAYSASEVYTPADVQDIVSYAAAEIDSPGHTAVIATSHPEHIACSQASPWSTFANEPPAGQLRLASPATVNFTASLFTAAAQVLPSKHFSTGGDELNTACYVQDAQTQADLKASGHTLEQALNVFTEATHGALAKLGKTPVVWEEMVLEHNLTLSKDTVVMSVTWVWISSQNAALVAAKNFQIVHSPSDYFYLDCGAGEWIGKDPTGTPPEIAGVTPSNVAEVVHLRPPRQYNCRPSAPSSRRATTLVDRAVRRAEPRLDRVAARRTSAEIFWTGAKGPDGSALDGTEALPRLHDLRYRMVQRGVGAIALQPQWCALRPQLCNLDS